MGRKQRFDRDEVLEASMREFWRTGYEGTTIAAICKAIGASKPSLYRFFPTKADLFVQALDLYARRHLQFVDPALAEPTIMAAIRRLLLGLVEVFTDPSLPGGCLSLNSTLIRGKGDEIVHAQLLAWRASYQCRLEARLVQARTAGDLPAGLTPSSLAAFLMAIAAGIAMEAKAGTPRDVLQRVINIVLMGLERHRRLSAPIAPPD